AVEAVDDYTVIIKLETPFDMWWRWRAYYAIPRKYFDEVGREGFMKYPIGVGPFKWVEGDIADYIVLERYEKYYGGPVLPGEVDQIPAVDRVIFRFISESTTRVAALLAGDVDIIQNIPPDSVKMLVENSGINVISVGGTRIATLFFNSNKPPFNNKRVRQAVAYAIDLDLIIEHQLLGFAEALKGRPFLIPFPGTPESGYYEHIQSPYDYNPERAKALLEETGVTGSSIILDAVPELSEVAQSISQMLNDIGFNTSVRVWERGVIREEFIKGQRDILIENWGRASRDPDWIKVIASTGDRGNLGNYSNPAFDDLILTAMHMDPNDPKRYDMYIEAYELAMEELPVFSLFTADEIEACQSYVKNYYPDTTGRVILHRVDIE
ncbi:MAG: ABC transporter substrate-binding protein, partial [Syntrophomonadaceae bacterium]|nr:ABC transporter substrate-binding protein [Syntrophomonadaceae bacterium]